MPMLALDFDGVVSDSAPESFLVALRTWRALHPDSRLGEELLGAGGAPDRATIRSDALFRAFLDAMPLGNRAEDYGVVLACLDAATPLPHQSAYDAAKGALPDDFLHAFHERFYRERHDLAAADPEAWGALMGPFDFLLPILRERAGDTLLAIATAKDRPSVDALLARYGLVDLFPPERVADKEVGVSKRAHLSLLAERFEVPPAELTFVDDKVNHLEDVASLGVRCVLAGWGYNAEREWSRARAQGFAVARREDAESVLFLPRAG